jgi:hypothetical protein
LYAESSVLFKASTFFNTLNSNITTPTSFLVLDAKETTFFALSFLLVPQYMKVVCRIAFQMSFYFHLTKYIRLCICETSEYACPTHDFNYENM